MSLPTGPNFSLSARAHVAMSPKQPALSTTTTSVHQPSTSTSNSLSTSTTSPSSTRAGASFSPHSPSSPFTSQPTPSTNPVQAPPPEASSELLPQCINEKVKAALEDDMELSQIALSSPIVLSPTGAPSDALRGPSRTRGNNLTGPSHPVRSRSRGRTGQMQQFQSHTTISSDREWDEKRGLRDPAPGSPVAGGRHLASPPVRSSSLTPASFASPHSCDMGRPSASPPPYSTLPPNYASSYSSSVRRMLLTERLKPWVPFLAYAGTTFGFILAIMFWKDEVFGGLDELATWLRGKGSTGYAVMFFMIFLTCIPPLPLYSTLQVLSGYTFGAWTGAIVSYFSALVGAIFVFTLSRSIPTLRTSITACMSHSRGFQRVVRAISKRPSLLFLVRLAPYPYNVLNALLAGCPRLTFRTYVSCTALSLLKVIVHTSIGAGIQNFAAYHTPKTSVGSDLPLKDANTPTLGGTTGTDSNETGDTHYMHRMSSLFGISLCVVLAVYLSFVARRAVDEELGDDDDLEVDECGECDIESAGFERRGRSFSSRWIGSHIPSRISVPRGTHASSAERTAFLAHSSVDEDLVSGLGPDFSAYSNSTATRSEANLNIIGGRGEMVERSDGAGRFECASPVPLSSLSSMPYGLHEWAR